MPAGVGWSTYLKMFTASMLSMMAGAQTVHMVYRPLEDLSELVEVEKEKIKKEAVLIKSQQGGAGQPSVGGKDSIAAAAPDKT